MAAYKGHPAWLGKAMQSGGGVPTQAKTRDELEQALVPGSHGMGHAATAGTSGAAAYKLLQPNVLSKMLPRPVRGIAAGLAAGLAAKSGKDLADDFGKKVDSVDAESELKKRAKADTESGGYAKGGTVSKKGKRK